ncbi:MAG: helix-turn-helix domain-containing protein, partial [Planctomycetota bacterium]
MINNRRMGNILERMGLNITLLREQRGLTQEKLAALAGLHRAYIGQVERGEMIEQTCKEIGYRFRRRKITPVVTVRLPLRLWQRLFEQLSGQAQSLSEAYDKWKGHRIVLADGTCVSMSAEPELFDAFGVNTGYHGSGRYRLARLVSLCLAGTMTIIDYAIGGYRDGESKLAFGILQSLRKGDLLVADRHFAAAHFYVRYQSMGLEFLTR